MPGRMTITEVFQSPFGDGRFLTRLGRTFGSFRPVPVPLPGAGRVSIPFRRWPLSNWPSSV